jgi:hypothetical protein
MHAYIFIYIRKPPGPRARDLSSRVQTFTYILMDAPTHTHTHTQSEAPALQKCSPSLRPTNSHTYTPTYAHTNTHTQSPNPRSDSLRKSEALDEAKSSSKQLQCNEIDEEEIVEATQHEPDDDYEPESKKGRADRVALSKTTKSPTGKGTSNTSSSEKSAKSKRGSNPAVEVLTALAESAAAAKRGGIDEDGANVDSGLKRKATPLQNTELNDSNLSMLATAKVVSVVSWCLCLCVDCL